MDRFINNVNAIREERGLTIQALADLIPMDRSDLSKLLRGEHSPTIATLDKIAAGLNIDPAALISDTPPSRRKFAVPA
jgi:transcriptional regulator with XRE-family HTH domain